MSKEDQVLRALEKFESKIDRLDTRLDSVEKVLVKQEANIEHHVKRCDEIEESNKLLRTELKTDMKPVQDHVAYMNGALKALGIIATVVAIVAGLVKVIEFFI
jgi:predicted  nucleic acid-binding Zn-ribbon protein